ncbi:pirin family protein [Paucibacter sp. TC2R-5]|uniref:pirin family protein n=1 Tax=Paucibacter sp. TC2R-5 TaxID=2893555 RepID=UPI0021E46F24|nr:pirin family protein [Paucibacter sp. TC2R-5]MCV2358983.1 pirin family protein [Paucibacter sp. TC2R-5]
MLELIKSSQRGYADHGWLKSFHSFSFADYVNEKRMGFGALRVINEDRIAAGTGFGTHGHRDMEIISYVLEGELAHKDSIGTGTGDQGPGVIRPGDVQRMSAGSGVRHSEFNHAQGKETHFLQIWIQPDRLGVAPSYEQAHFTAGAKRGRLALIASGDGAAGSVTLNADARLYAGLFEGTERAELALAPGRISYVHLVRGSLVVNGQALQAGDALQISAENKLVLEGGQGAEVLVFDLAA